jgi:diaminohydroxyphosphoribosylaminopyrimidine deaminase/5-amino-6-(5-phosphoribosylamino)uracil reductase
VAGNGIKKTFPEAGINVTVGVLKKVSGTQQTFFLLSRKKKTYYLENEWTKVRWIYKAQRNEKPVWITNPYSRQLVLDGVPRNKKLYWWVTQTVIDDNPHLNARDWYGKNPIQLALDQNNRIQMTVPF